MWIEIDKTIFENSNFKGLNYLFQILSWFPIGSIPRYNIFVDKELCKNTVNFETLNTIETKFDELIESEFDKYINDSGNRVARDYIVSIENQNVRAFNIEEAIRFLNQPVSIVLENNKNDAYFIKSIIYNFDTTEIVKEHLKNGWIRFENAGGCGNIQNFIEGDLKIFEDLALRNNTSPEKYYRGLIILDSDKSFKNETKKPLHSNLEQCLDNKNISHHILNKRMMENYMPDEVFESIEMTTRNLKLKEWISAYNYLNDEQKDYLNIYSGFPKDDLGNRKALDPNVANLYKDVSPQNLDILDRGFKYPNFKNSFSELFFNSDRVNKHSLEIRSKSNELNDILNQIRTLL